MAATKAAGSKAATKATAKSPSKAVTKAKSNGKAKANGKATETTTASATTTSGARLTDAQVAEVLGLLKGAKTVELKLTVPEGSYRATARSLKLDPLDAQIRQVVFFDTPDLALNKSGVVVRARRSQGAPDDTVVKLRPVVPHDLPPELRMLDEFGVELDALPGGFVCSASYKAELAKNHVRAAVNGDRRISKLFSPGQREFYAAHAPDGLDLDDLSILGPLNVLKLKYVPTDFARRLVVELWLYPDGSRILELSTKCRPDEAFHVAAESRAYLSERNIDLSGEQATKTSTALNFFAAELKA